MQFTWGDSVYLKKLDEHGKVVSKVPAAVIWVTQVETEEDVKRFGLPIGANLYNIEFGDGSMQEFVREDVLESFSSNNE